MKMRDLISSNTSIINAEPYQHIILVSTCLFGLLCTVWIAVWIVLKRDPMLKVRDLISDIKSIDDAEPLQQHPRFDMTFWLPGHYINRYIDRPEARFKAESA